VPQPRGERVARGDGGRGPRDAQRRRLLGRAPARRGSAWARGVEGSQRVSRAAMAAAA
jgi:hypothetical protein